MYYQEVHTYVVCAHVVCMGMGECVGVFYVLRVLPLWYTTCSTYHVRTTRIIVLLWLILVCILYLSYFTSLPGFLLSVYVFSPIFQLTTHVPLHCVVSFSLSTVSTFASVTGIGGAATAVLDGLISIGGLVS